MSLIFGLFSLDGQTLPEGVLERLEAACDWPRDRVLRKGGANAALINIQRDAVSRQNRPTLEYSSTDLLFTGRLDNREDLAASLDLGSAAALDDEELIVAAFRAYGTEFARHLVGDFALCLRDHASGNIVLARDAVGAMPLFRTQVGGLLAISNCIEYLRMVPGIDLSWDSAWLADTLALSKRDFEQTPYAAIGAVPPAHVIEIARERSEHSHRFWSLPTHDCVMRIDEEEATGEFRRLFDQAVACRMRSPTSVGCELSAGLDSTAIVASAMNQESAAAEPIHAFTHALPESGELATSNAGDDRQLLAPLLAQWTSLHHHWVTSETDSLVGTIRRSLSRHGAPPRNDLNTIGEELPRRLRDNDIRVLLSGFGGDQLVTWHGAGYFQSLIDEHDFASLTRLIGERHGSTIAWLAAIYHLLGFGKRRREEREMAAVQAKSSDIPLLGTADFLGTFGHSGRKQDRPLRGNMREREAWLLNRPHIAYRLQDSAVGAAAFGFEYRYPMLDTRLLEFAHNLPARLKREPGQDRCMIRRITRGRLPDSIRLRGKESGSTVPAAQFNFCRHAGELARLIEQGSHDIRLAGIIDFAPAFRTLQKAQDSGEFSGPLVKKQVLLLALLSLWAERDQAGEQLPGGQ